MGSFSRIVLVLLTALAVLSGQRDQSLAQERIRIAWAGVSPANSPIWVVQERGLLKKHGLNGEVISISASPIALQALLAGEVDVIVTSVTTLALSRLAGADIVMMLGMVPTFLDHIISHTSVTALEQIKGKRRGKPPRQHFGFRASAGATTQGHRSGKGRQDCYRRRQSGETGGDFSRDHSVQYHAGAFCPRS
jgi:ABC-type nitrate/sulfonate/bicarbonate transport system substrate-binding protein